MARFSSSVDEAARLKSTRFVRFHRSTTADEERVFVRELNADESTSPPKSARFARRLPPVVVDVRDVRVHAHRHVYVADTANNPISCLAPTPRRLLAVGDAAGNASLLHLQRGVKAWTAAAPETDRGVAGVADVAFGLPLPDFPAKTCSPCSNPTPTFDFTRSRRGRARNDDGSQTPSEAFSISLHRLSGAPADVVPPRASAESWFAPPASFAYKFLASEFEVDDELDVDAEDAILSTDEEEPEPDSADDGRRGDPKFTAIVVTVTEDALRAYHAVGCSRGERFTSQDASRRRTASRRVRRARGRRRRGVRTRSRDVAHRRRPRRDSVVTYAVPSLREIGAFGPVPAASNADVAGGSRGGCVVVLANDGHSLARFETFLRGRRASGADA